MITRTRSGTAIAQDRVRPPGRGFWDPSQDPDL